MVKRLGERAQLSSISDMDIPIFPPLDLMFSWYLYVSDHTGSEHSTTQIMILARCAFTANPVEVDEVVVCLTA